MLNQKQKQIILRAKQLQTKFADTLIATKGKEKYLKDAIINKGYALIDNSDELINIIDALVEKVKEANARAESAVTLMEAKGRKLFALERKMISHRNFT